MKPKFLEVLEAEIEKQKLVIRSLNEEISRSFEGKELVDLMNNLSTAKRILIPLKKVLEAYEKNTPKGNSK